MSGSGPKNWFAQIGHLVRAGWRGYHDFAHAGGSPYEAYFAANCVTSASPTMITLSRNVIYATACVVPNRPGITLDTLSINVLVDGGGDVVFGVWADERGYLGALLGSFGPEPMGTGVIQTSASLALTPGSMIHVGIVFDAPGHDVSGLLDTACSAAYGYAPDFVTPQTYIEAAYTFDGSMPDPFPATPSGLLPAPCPAIFLHFSA